MLTQYADAFSKDVENIGQTMVVEHQIWVAEGTVLIW